MLHYNTQGTYMLECDEASQRWNDLLGGTVSGWSDQAWNRKGLWPGSRLNGY